MLLQALLLGMLSSCRSWPGPKSGHQGKLPMVLFVFSPGAYPLLFLDGRLRIFAQRFSNQFPSRFHMFPVSE
jgi:hypothetical protein